MSIRVNACLALSLFHLVFALGSEVRADMPNVVIILMGPPHQVPAYLLGHYVRR